MNKNPRFRNDSPTERNNPLGDTITSKDYRDVKDVGRHSSMALMNNRRPAAIPDDSPRNNLDFNATGGLKSPPASNKLQVENEQWNETEEAEHTAFRKGAPSTPGSVSKQGLMSRVE